MTVEEITRAYKRDGKLVRGVAKVVAKGLRAGTIAGHDFVDKVPLPVLMDAYERFGERYPLKYAAWDANLPGAAPKPPRRAEPARPPGGRDPRP